VATGATPGLQIDPYLTEQTAQWYVAAGALLIGYAVAVLLLYGVDLLAPRRITGQVLWRELWKRRLEGPTLVEWLHYLAVDDGRADRTTAWLLPAGLADRGEPGDTVTVTVRRLTRLVTACYAPRRPSPDRPAGIDQAPPAG
jgi:hypothetical protein